MSSFGLLPWVNSIDGAEEYRQVFLELIGLEFLYDRRILRSSGQINGSKEQRKLIPIFFISSCLGRKNKIFKYILFRSMSTAVLQVVHQEQRNL